MSDLSFTVHATTHDELVVRAWDKLRSFVCPATDDWKTDWELEWTGRETVTVEQDNATTIGLVEADVTARRKYG